MKINKPLILFIIVAVFINTIHSQNENHIDGKNHKKANLALSFLKAKDSTNSIVYIKENKVLTVIEKTNGFNLKILSYDKKSSKFNIEKSEHFDSKNKLLKNAFKSEQETIKMFSENKFYGSSYVYFRLTIDNRIEKEFNLPFITYGTPKREYEFPISKKLLSFLSTKILNL